MTRRASPTIALLSEAGFGTASNCIGETGVGDHIGRDGWTEGVLERAILGLLADDAMGARLRDNAAGVALKPGPDVAAEAMLSLTGT